MADRRQGDRREPEKGVIKIQFKDAVIYVVLAAIIIISIIFNIVLGIKLHHYRELYEESIFMDTMDDNFIEDDYIDEIE